MIRSLRFTRMRYWTVIAAVIVAMLAPLQRDFASDPVSRAARTYLSLETMSIGR